MRYKVHQFKLDMNRDQMALEDFLNGLEGEIISILPNVTFGPSNLPRVDFVLIIERTDETWQPRRDRGEKIPEDIVVP